MSSQTEPDVLARLQALEAQVAALQAREDIRRQLDAYADAIDVRDREALREVFTDDVKFVVTRDGSVRQGWDELWYYLADLLAPMGPTLHYSVGNVDINVNLESGTARSTHVGVAQHERDGAFVAAALTYNHSWQREQDGQWRICHRAIQPWYFCRLDELLAYGWDPAATDATAAQRGWLPAARATWLERIDQRTMNF